MGVKMADGCSLDWSGEGAVLDGGFVGFVCVWWGVLCVEWEVWAVDLVWGVKLEVLACFAI